MEETEMSFATKIRSYAIILGLLAICSVCALAQIPNPGFETWSLGVPNGWITNNALGVDTTVVRTTDAHSGTYAAQGIVTTFASVTIPPTLSSQFPWTTKSSTLTGYYKYSPVGGDTLIIAALLAKSSTAIAAGIFKTTAAAASYTQFSIPITLFTVVTPDSAGVYFAIAPATGSALAHAGSTFKVDDVSLGGATSVESNVGQTPQTYALQQNFPNPFNPATNISFSIPLQSAVHLSVIDLLGREVAVLVNDDLRNAGSYTITWNAAGVSSGVYFYRLQAGDFVSTRKLILLK
jgi:hypothetical protein